MTSTAFAIRRRVQDVGAVGAGAVASMAALFWMSDASRGGIVPFAVLPLIFFYPGYALLAASGCEELAATERVLLSIGTSIVMTIAGGLVLHLTGLGLQTLSWAALLGIPTIVACLFAGYRRHVAPTPPQRARHRPAVTNPTGQSRKAVSIIVALAVFAGVTWAALVTRIEPPRTGFTQFWSSPLHGSGDGSIRLGINNLEDRATTYHLRLVARDAVVREWTGLRLAPGARWEIEVPHDNGAQRPVRALLMRQDQPDIAYRSLVLW